MAQSQYEWLRNAIIARHSDSIMLADYIDTPAGALQKDVKRIVRIASLIAREAQAFDREQAQQRSSTPQCAVAITNSGQQRKEQPNGAR